MYRSCEEISIWNLNKIFTTKDLKFMFSNYEDIEHLEVTEEIAANWESLYFEFLELLADPGMLLYYELSKDLQYLQSRFAITQQLLKIVFHRYAKDLNSDKYIAELRLWGFKINPNKDLLEEIARMTRQLKGSEVRIRIVEKELKDLKQVQGEPLSLVTQGVKLELALGKDNIDLKTTSAAKWIVYYKELEELNAHRRLKNGKLQ